ncbi:MAG: PASTA domain-containing protein [Bacteroidetes bacterium]|nr:PASTA domain-containing protein [Bacteroidota bacterium]
MPWFVNEGGTTVIPNVVGLKEEAAFALLDSMNLEPKRGEVRYDDSLPEGYVVSQNPPQSQVVKSGRRVYLIISGGDLPAIVPSLRGRTIRDAKFSLDRAGLRQGAITYTTSPDFPEGTIILQDIAPGTRVKKNSFVSLTVSAGVSIDSIVVPSLIGKTLSDAQKILKEKGLKVGNITYQIQPDLLPNTVLDQFPPENKIVTIEKSVDLFIAQAPEKKSSKKENNQ